ncbi:YbjN domain-containing protein [Micromonospora sp. NPDC003197]
MAGGMLNPEDVTTEGLRKIFDDAYLETSLDGDGDLVVRDNYSVLVLPRENGERIRLMSMFGVDPESALEDRLQLANKINDVMVLVRASLSQHGGFCFDYDITVTGGLPIRTFMATFRRFLRCMEEALTLDENDVLT